MAKKVDINGNNGNKGNQPGWGDSGNTGGQGGQGGQKVPNYYNIDKNTPTQQPS